MPILDALWLLGARMSPVLAEGAGADAAGSGDPAAVGQANFQPYIFWAYGLACVFLLAFGVWSALQMKELRRRVDALQDRVEDAVQS